MERSDCARECCSGSYLQYGHLEDDMKEVIVFLAAAACFASLESLATFYHAGSVRCE